MKTVNGVPQLDSNDTLFCASVNAELRKWSESRRCVKCKWFESLGRKGEPLPRCCLLEYLFDAHNIKTLSPETFSCAAFEDKK